MMMERFVDRPVEGLKLSAAVSEGTGLKTVQLAPWGTVKSKNGTFIIDQPAVDAIVASFTERGVELPFDVEHSSVSREFPPDQRGAVGWIVRVFGEVGRGLFALTRWMPRGVALIREGRFQYTSPVLFVNKSDRRAVELHSAALTNFPAIGGQERLAASNRHVETETVVFTEGTAMELVKQIGAALGMEESASVVDVLQAALKKLGTAKSDETVAASVRKKLGVAEDAGEKEVLLALAIRPSGAETELTKLRQDALEKEANELVQGMIRGNVIHPKDAESIAFAKSLAMESPERFQQIMRLARPVISPGRIYQPSAELDDPASRTNTIRNACNEFRKDHNAGKFTSLLAFANQALRDRGFEKLTETDRINFSIPAT